MKVKSMKSMFVVQTLMALMFINSCSLEKKYEKEEKDSIQQYLADNPDLNFELKPSGLYYLDVVVGTGVQPAAHDSVFLKYTGRYIDGILFDTNVGTSKVLKFVVLQNEVIAGLDEGLTYMKEGGKAKLLIPSSLAYGPAGYYNIPGYTPLVFDIELLSVKKNP
ncbi:MAG: FKBP-type peptidyl-prolyl cis-trans isomerase [Bacteroidales bacterium]|nr:FKBP-type peptidyl-prolyl cis-trans isomerase [Bacteroidales bacterium]